MHGAQQCHQLRRFSGNPQAIAEGLAGTPFARLGRDSETGLDCLGLVLEFFARGGVTLPDPVSDDIDDVLSAAIADAFVEIPLPEPLAVVRFGPKSLGVLMDSENVLHAHRRAGATIHPLARIENEETRFYRLLTA